MRQVIINADDCGISQKVDQEIERFIQLGKITSTTVMANMDDLEGAKQLYEKYGDNISFGIHLNLTEGSPLICSNLLFDKGFLKEEKGKIVFNFRSHFQELLSKSVYKDVKLELQAQIDAVKQSGIKISHIDGHHFVQTSIMLSPILPEIIKYAGVKKVRRTRNYCPASLNRLFREVWVLQMRLRLPHINTTDYFSSFSEYASMRKRGYFPNGVVELMTHPGGLYPDENNLILSSDYKVLFSGCDLINYASI